MSASKDPHGDERVEELLSQLQGIFGRLSHTEEEESQEKVSPPVAEPAPAPPSEPPPVNRAAPMPAPPPPLEIPEPFEIKSTSSPFDPSPAVEAPPPEPPPPMEAPPVMETVPFAVPPAALDAVETPAVPTAPSEALWQTTSTDPSAIPVALFFPEGREPEAKTLSQKLETLTPKFMKATFQLSVRLLAPYNPKSDWKQLAFAQDRIQQTRALFLILDRPLDEERRKAFTAELDQHGIYFQDVPLSSIEKKAFYTDLLLGMVFFFDAHKPTPPA